MPNTESIVLALPPNIGRDFYNQRRLSEKKVSLRWTFKHKDNFLREKQ